MMFYMMMMMMILTREVKQHVLYAAKLSKTQSNSANYNNSRNKFQALNFWYSNVTSEY